MRAIKIIKRHSCIPHIFFPDCFWALWIYTHTQRVWVRWLRKRDWFLLAVFPLQLLCNRIRSCTPMNGYTYTTCWSWGMAYFWWNILGIVKVMLLWIGELLLFYRFMHNINHICALVVILAIYCQNKNLVLGVGSSKDLHYLLYRGEVYSSNNCD